MLNNYNSMDFIFGLLVIFIVIIVILIKKMNSIKKRNNIMNSELINEEENIIEPSSPLYSCKNFMTYNERKLFSSLLEIEKMGNYKVHPQLNLASVIVKNSNNSYYNDLFRNIDFAIFDSNYNKLLLLIELNDETHNNKKRIARDIKVKNICDIAKIPLITFYTKYPNDKNYVINRVLNLLNNNKSQEEDNEA